MDTRRIYKYNLPVFRCQDGLDAVSLPIRVTKPDLKLSFIHSPLHWGRSKIGFYYVPVHTFFTFQLNVLTSMNISLFSSIFSSLPITQRECSLSIASSTFASARISA